MTCKNSCLTECLLDGSYFRNIVAHHVLNALFEGHCGRWAAGARAAHVKGHNTGFRIETIKHNVTTW